MSNRHRSWMASLVLIGSVLLSMATPASAQVQRTVLIGTEVKAFGAGGRTWDAGPWLLEQDITSPGTFDFGALAGTETWVVNSRFDFSTGVGRVWGKATYTDTTSGVTCSGKVEGKVTDFLLTATIVAPCSDGSLLRGTIQDTSNNLVTLTSTFHGELLSP
jgi:hypothetical protein